MFLHLDSPWTALRDLDRVFDGLARVATGLHRTGWQDRVPVNVWADDGAVAITAELPGVRPEHLELTIEGDLLTLRARRPVAGPEGGWLMRERGEWSLHRTVQLPWRVDESSAEARLADGVLTVAIKRQESDRPRSIAVQAA